METVQSLRADVFLDFSDRREIPLSFFGDFIAGSVAGNSNIILF